MHATKSAMRKPRTIRISETFLSIEGEGPMTGVPTVFVRTFGCNFSCSGFGNPTGDKVIPIPIKTLDQFEPTFGCDSIYAWHPAYKNLTTNYTIEELANQIINLLPGKTVRNPRSGNVPILSITGGEPTLHQRSIIELISLPQMAEFDKLLIETNAAVTLTEDFIHGLTEWAEKDQRRLVMWSNSPKLKASGEAEVDAIRPDVIALQRLVPGCAQYLKFVSDGTRDSFEEIASVIKTYNKVKSKYGLNTDGIYVMPIGATLTEQEAVQRKIADLCLEYGYNFCARVHVNVYKNAVGT